MRPSVALCAWLLVCGNALAREIGDPANGALLERASCRACHAERFGGDADKVYSRTNRKIRSSAALSAQVRSCAQLANATWFPEEEADVVAYLNQRFYHFK